MVKRPKRSRLIVVLFLGLVVVAISLCNLGFQIISHIETNSLRWNNPDAVTIPRKENTINRDYRKVRLYTLANEVVTLMTSMVSATSPYGHPMYQRLTPHRALVFTAPSERVHEVYHLIYAARTLGEWDQDIVVLGEGFTPLQKEALTCLDAKWVDAANNEGVKVIRKELSWTTRFNAVNKLLFVLLPEFREYDILQYPDLDSMVVGPIKKVTRDDFDANVAILFEEIPSEQPCSIKIPSETTTHVDPSTCISTSNFAIFMWNLGRIDNNQMLDSLNKATKLVDSLGLLKDEFPEWEAYVLMYLLKIQWRSKRLGGVSHSTLSDPLGFEKQQPREFSFIYTKGIPSPSSPQSPYHTRYVFTTFLAGSFLRCHSSISSIIHPSRDKFELDLPTLSAVTSISRDYIEWIHRKKEQKTVAARYKNIGTAGFKQEANRVLVFWASKGFVEGAYAVAFQARTIGQWHQHMVLLTDEITDTNKAALDCLDVKIVYYNPVEFKKRFPWVEHNHWYYKLLPFLLPEFRKYDIVQYLDLDVVITGPLRQYSFNDFEPGVPVLMEDNGHDESFLVREDVSSKLSEEEKKAFLERFPGADSRLNGPNFSPSASASFDSFLVSKIESIDELYEMFSSVAKDYYKILRYGDQPLILLTFWGRWRMKYGGKFWRSPFENVFEESYKHHTTKGIVRYIHTGGAMRPSLFNSPYKPIEVFTNLLAADLLGCPEILKTSNSTF